MKKLTVLVSVLSALMLLASCASKSDTTTVRDEPAGTRPEVPMTLQPPNAQY